MAKWEVALTGSGLPNVARALRNSSLPNTPLSDQSSRLVYTSTNKGFVSVGTDASAWLLLPISIGLPVNNFEVLLETVRISNGTPSYLNTGGGLYFSNSPARISDADGYYVAFGTSSSTARRFVIFRRPKESSHTQLYASTDVIPEYSTGQVVFMRVRRSGSNIHVKVWDSTQSEPDTWQASVTDATYDVSGIAILTHGYSLANIYSRVAIATDGDTATFEEPLSTISGTAPTGNSYEVEIRSVITDTVIGYAYSSDTTGEWSFGLHSDEPVYAAVYAPDGPFYDYVFARGNGLLSGSFPLSLVTQGGNLPSQAEIRILYRPEAGHPGDGVVVATTTCNADGTWQVSGLNENLKFDIVARIPGFNDVIISNVQPMGAPLSAYFVGIKDKYHAGDEVEIHVIALGGVPPYEYQVVTLPDGLSFNSDTGSITGIIGRVYELTFEFLVSDGEGTQFPLKGTRYTNADPHWDKVMSLMHFADNVEDSTGNHLWVNNGGRFVDSIFSRGISINHNRLDRVVTNPIELGTDDFTLEFYFKVSQEPPIGSYLWLLAQDNILQRNWSLLYNRDIYAEGGISFNIREGMSIKYNVHVPISRYVLDRFVHIAVVRDKGNIGIFVGGVLMGTQEISLHSFPMYENLSIGYNRPQPNQNIVGEFIMDELRITKGVARYTEDFTPPSEPFPDY